MDTSFENSIEIVNEENNKNQSMEMMGQCVSGNGGCLFTSLGLCFLYLKLFHDEIENKYLNNLDLNGVSQLPVYRGFQIRLAIVQWFQSNMNVGIKELGHFIVDKNEREFTVRDVLNLELARKEDLPDEISKQNVMIYEYLKEMCNYDCWGSTPEYIAFSILTGISVHVWRRENNELILNDSFPKEPPELNSCNKKEIHLLFCFGNHYEPLLKKQIYDELKQKNVNFTRHFIKSFQCKI
jgi:hypothetical protein